jgi:hypothetical protein
MKSKLLPLSLILAVTTALILLPVSDLATAGEILTALGILTIFFSDYGRIIKPRGLPAEIIAFDSGARTLASLREAA